jgi:WD40 repeat protein
MDRLTPTERRCFRELAVFPADVDIPVSTVARYWALTAGLTPARSANVLRRLADLALLSGYRRAKPAHLGLHDVIRSYLRDQFGDDLPRLDATLIDAHRGLVAGEEWWRLPDDEDYLLTWVPTHLRESGRLDELAATICHPRWLIRKLERAGAAAVAADLALSGDPVPVDLAAAVRQNAHLLARLAPAGSAAATLASRLPRGTRAADLAEPLLSALGGACLAMTSPPPDLPNRALLRVLTHDGPALGSLAVPPDGRIVASGARDGSVRLWTGDDGAEIRTFAHGGSITLLAVAADGSWLASAGDGAHKVRTWDLAMTIARHVLEGPSGLIAALASTHDARWLAGGGDDGRVWLWDMRTGDLQHRLAGHEAPVRCLAISPDDTLLASGGGDFRRDSDTGIRLWNLRTGALRQVLSGHTAQIECLVFGPDGAWLASAGYDGIRVWETGTGRPVHTIDSGGPVNALISGRNGHWLAAAGGSVAGTGGGFVAVWMLGRTRGPVPQLRWRVSGIPPQNALALSPDERTLLGGGGAVRSGLGDHLIRLFDVESGALQGSLVGHSDTVRQIAVPRHGRWYASASGDQTVRIWAPAEHRPAPTDAAADSGVAVLATDPAGRWLASASSSPANGDEVPVRVWDTETGTLVTAIAGHSRTVTAMTFGPDGSWLASAGRDRMVRIWTTGSWDLRFELGPHPFWVNALGSVRRSHIAVAGDGFVQIWDLTTAEPIVRFDDYDQVLNAVVIAPDLSWVAASGGEAGPLRDNPVLVWNLRTGRRTHTLSGHHGEINALVSSPDGSWLASAGANRVRVWGTADGLLRHELAVHDGHVRLLQMGPHGSWLAPAGLDGTVRIWDPRTGTGLHVLSGHHGSVNALALIDGPRGPRLCSAGEDGTVRVWDPRSGAGICAIRVDGPLTALAANGPRLQAGGVCGCYFLQVREEEGSW